MCLITHFRGGLFAVLGWLGRDRDAVCECNRVCCMCTSSWLHKLLMSIALCTLSENPQETQTKRNHRFSLFLSPRALAHSSLLSPWLDTPLFVAVWCCSQWHVFVPFNARVDVRVCRSRTEFPYEQKMTTEKEKQTRYVLSHWNTLLCQKCGSVCVQQAHELECRNQLTVRKRKESQWEDSQSGVTVLLTSRYGTLCTPLASWYMHSCDVSACGRIIWWFVNIMFVCAWVVSKWGKKSVKNDRRKRVFRRKRRVFLKFGIVQTAGSHSCPN